MTVRILGIETSCDETAAAVIEDGTTILSNVVASQAELHAQYGGVFPELASRMHVESIIPTVDEALAAAYVGWDDLDAIAVTYGPGLPGSLLVGLNYAKGAALAKGLPLVPVNHLEGHLYAHWLNTGAEGSANGKARFPLIALIVSGGHTDLILAHDHGRYERLGSTLDDAAGEAFDKVARMLKLGYPGGPAIEQAAKNGDPQAFDLPRAWLPGTYDFSFSGLKTAVLRVQQRYTEGFRSSQFLRQYGCSVSNVGGRCACGRLHVQQRNSVSTRCCCPVACRRVPRCAETCVRRWQLPVYTLRRILCTISMLR